MPVVWPKTRDTRALPSTPYLPFRARIHSRFWGNKSGVRRERLSAQRPQRIRPSGNIQQYAIPIFPAIALPGRPSLKQPLPSGSIMSIGGPAAKAAHRITRHCQKTI